MSTFLLSNEAIKKIEKSVFILTADCQLKEPVLSALPSCGCGAGGTCASSCVSGCAERGGCGPGPR